MTVTAEQLNATHIDAENSELRQIPVNAIVRNPDNPRILFRQGELEQLLESIRLYGVQVPISVYRQGQKFVLIDGERRWKCALKLNKKTIPALIQDKPTPLTNLLLMFNIHALREQWDLFTIAMKLPKVIALLESKLGTKANERQIANETGLARSVIRRSKLLIDLPNQYKDMILSELNKPKSKQKLTEDLFIELERALKTVTSTFLLWSRANKRTWREDVYRSKSILAFFGKDRLDEISSAQIEKFKMKRQQTPIKNGSERRPATVNRELENLSRMFNLAIDMGIPLTNPCLKIQSLSEDNERNRYLSDAEERRLLDVLQGRRKHLRSIVLIDLQTGLTQAGTSQLALAKRRFRARYNSRYELAPRTN